MGPTSKGRDGRGTVGVEREGERKGEEEGEGRGPCLEVFKKY